MSITSCVDSDFSRPDGGTELPSETPDAARSTRDASVDAPRAAPDTGVRLQGDDASGPGQAIATPPPAWATPLLGHYALRVRNFAREKSTGAGTSHEIISAAQVFYDEAAAEVRLRVKMCQDIGDSLGLVKAMLAYPHWYPQRLLRVVYENGEFYTESITVDTIGYDNTPRADCSMPGQLVMRSDAQTWLGESGTCECPGPAYLMPARKEDCRVTDPDRDSSPGITLLSDFGGVKGRDYVVSRDDSQIEHAKIDVAGRKHEGGYRIDQQIAQLECPGGTCARAELKSCPPEQNEVDFAPLDARSDDELWPCADLLMVAPSVLPPNKLQFPDQCPQ